MSDSLSGWKDALRRNSFMKKWLRRCMLGLAIGAGAAFVGMWPLTHGASHVAAQAAPGQ